MELSQIIGIAAATLTSIAGLPQLLKVIKTKHTKDLSLEMLIIICTGIFLWIVYGTLRKDPTMIFGNIVPLGIYLCLLWLKLKYK